jgi:hypothetical protein
VSCRDIPDLLLLLLCQLLLLLLLLCQLLLLLLTKSPCSTPRC